jgi:16S rRNA processing protein RimM
MSEGESHTPEPLVTVARAVKTRGLRGELVADLLTDFPARFELLSKLIAVGPAQQRLELQLEDHWFQNQRVVLKFRGYDTVDSASALVGYELAVPEADRMPLDEGSFYDWELEGCAVKSVSGEPVGVVSGVLRTGGVDLLAIKSGRGKEHLVPMVVSIITNVDLAAREIIIDPPEGLLEL